MKEAQDVQRAGQSVEAERENLADLEASLKAEIAALEAADLLAETLETISLKPRRTDIAVRLVSLVWEATD